MFSYIKSEFYRLFRNKGSYLFIVICSLLLLSSNVVLAIVKSTDSKFPYATTDFSLSNVYTNMIMVFILCIMVSIMVFGNEHNNHTMKNCISYGISRRTIYFGKLIVQILYAFVAFTIILGIHVASGYLLLENSGPQPLEVLLRTCFACLPLFLFGLAVANCFVFVIESVGSAIAASCGIMIVLPLVTQLLGMRFVFFEKFSEILPANIINAADFDPIKQEITFYWSTNTGLLNCWSLGMIQMVLFVLIGYVLFNRKEIK